MKTKLISKRLFSGKLFFILSVLVFADRCNLKSEPPLFIPAPKSPLAVGENPNDVALADVNGDGQPDIVTVNSGSRDISVLLGDGTGNFTPVKNSLALDSTSHLVVMGDVNNNKQPDVLISSHDSYGVTLLLGNGQGNFSSAPGSPFSVLDSARPHNHGLATGDINKDGNLDFVTSNYGYHSVSLMLGNGKGGFAPAPASPFNVGRGPYPLVLGDVNKDGNLDLITPNVSSDNVSVLLGDGKGNFSSAPNSPFAVETRP
ncbi:MAG: VCBS repeat-containing protein, partial [candidate division Zixibacteria bacterium]|nr:VCBS repeat-containing protein [candidate division Zixibacteria bacterium]